MNEPKAKPHILRDILEFVADVALNTLIIIFVIILIRFVVVSPFEINGSSMKPNLDNKEYILVNKLTYRFDEPQRGDIIVLVPPQNPATFYVKRIIGLPGEKVEFSGCDVIIHNEEMPTGVKLDESKYLGEEPPCTRLPSGNNKTVKIPENHYFVMGDNRNSSNDSRSWIEDPGMQRFNKSGALHRQNIIGKVWLRLFPVKNLGIVPHTTYNIM